MDRMDPHPLIEIPNRKPFVSIKEVVTYINMNFSVDININASEIFLAISGNKI